MDIRRFDDEQRPSSGDRLLHGALTGQVINAFFATYDTIGFGYAESVCCNAFVIELRSRGLRVEREVPIDVWYKDSKAGHFRADILVESAILVEVKAIEYVNAADKRQLVNYLRGTSIEVGLLFHFGPKPFFHRFYFENRNKPSPALRRVQP
jgi:GxxExxY protein